MSRGHVYWSYRGLTVLAWHKSACLHRHPSREKGFIHVEPDVLQGMILLILSGHNASTWQTADILAEPDFIHFLFVPVLYNLDHTRRLPGNLKCDASKEYMMLSSLLKHIVEEATIQYTSTTYSIRGTRLLESWHMVNSQLCGLQMINCESSPLSKLSLTPQRWLTWQLLPRLQRQVALKIVKSENSKNNKELSTFLRLSASRLEHPGKAHVIELLDYFEHDGPNGTHLCLVLPAMLSDGTAMTVTRRPHDAAYVQAISNQISLGLDFLHTLDLVHYGRLVLRALELTSWYSADTDRFTTGKYNVFSCRNCANRIIFAALWVQSCQVARRNKGGW